MCTPVSQQAEMYVLCPYRQDCIPCVLTGRTVSHCSNRQECLSLMPKGRTVRPACLYRQDWKNHIHSYRQDCIPHVLYIQSGLYISRIPTCGTVSPCPYTQECIPYVFICSAGSSMHYSFSTGRVVYLLFLMSCACPCLQDSPSLIGRTVLPVPLCS